MEKHPNPKRAYTAAAILLILLAAGAYAFAKFDGTDSSEPTPSPVAATASNSPTPTPSPSASATADPKATWKSYTSDYVGLTLKYPPTLEVTDKLYQPDEKGDFGRVLSESAFSLVKASATAAGSEQAVLRNEGCSGRYMFHWSTQANGTSDAPFALDRQDAYTRIDGATISNETIGGKPAYRVSGTYSEEAAFSVPGEHAEEVYVDMNGKGRYGMYEMCAANSGGTVAEFNDILSTITYP